MKICIIGPGFQTSLTYNVFSDTDPSDESVLLHATQHYLELFEKGKPFIIAADEGQAFTVYYPRPGDHFVIMSDKMWRQIQREQQFAIANQGRRR